MRLCGFKYAKRLEAIADTTSTLLRNDRYQFAVVLYSFYSGIDFTEVPIDSIRWDQFGRFDNSFRKHMVVHLIKVIKLNTGLGPTDLLSHPYFWSVEKMSFFEIRMRTFSASNQHFDEQYEDRKEFVFTGKWTDRLSSSVRNACVNPKSKRGGPIKEADYIGLAQARRNRNQNRDEDGSDVQSETGSIPVENFLFWEGLFPTFLIYMFIKSLKFYKKTRGRFLYLEPEFSEFFTGSEEFYDTCDFVGL